MAHTTILEASASCRQDATFRVPVPKLRSLRVQVQNLLDLPHAASYNSKWSILCDDLCQILTGLEMHCRLRGGPENKEVQILRLKSLLSVVCHWPHNWEKLDDEDYFRILCRQTDWTADSWWRWTTRLAEETVPSQEEKYASAAEHLQALTRIRDLPEASWIWSAVDELQLLDRKENKSKLPMEACV